MEYLVWKVCKPDSETVLFVATLDGNFLYHLKFVEVSFITLQIYK